MLTSLKGGVSVCVTATLLDGLVLARSGFNHSMNYRSVMILGTARELTEPAAKRAALDAIVNPGVARPGGCGARSEPQGFRRPHGPRRAGGLGQGLHRTAAG